VGKRSTVVLVDKDGRVQGESPKLDAHRAPGRLHLAFSVFLFRPDGRMLLQQRAVGKYHFPGLWANACCSHPAPGEEVIASGEARVREELGISCDLADAGWFVYRAECASTGLVEHELDHVLVGTTTSEPLPNREEVADTCWVEPDRLTGEEPLARLETSVGARLAPWLLPALEVALGAPSPLGGSRARKARER